MVMQTQITKRSLYQGRRRSVVFDARCGETCDCRVTATTFTAAIVALTAEHAYVTSSPSLERHGCKLSAIGFESWCFEFRRGTGRGASMTFAAKDWIVAYERSLADYGTHEDCVAFFFPSRAGNAEDASRQAFERAESIEEDRRCLEYRERDM